MYTMLVIMLHMYNCINYYGVPAVHGDVGDLSELLEAAHEGLGCGIIM